MHRYEREFHSDNFSLLLSGDRCTCCVCPWLGNSSCAGFGRNFPLFFLLKETFTGIDSFPLMAVPFFILAAELMSGGSLTEVLLKFAGQFVGHKRGGLGYTNVVSLTFSRAFRVQLWLMPPGLVRC